MRRTTRLTLKRIYVYLKWACVCLFWVALFDYLLHPWIAAVLACLCTVELFMDPDNWREQRLMRENIIWIPADGSTPRSPFQGPPDDAPRGPPSARQ